MSDRRSSSRLIGLTGGIGTGKSRVAKLLEELGAAIECSDLIVRELQAPGGAGLLAIAEHFGDAYLTAAGELDRAKLGDLVFSDPEARQVLNGIIHPLVFGEFDRRIQRHRTAEVRVIVIDIPLLLEGKQAGRGSGALLPFDEIVLVYAREEQQLRRVMERDGLPEKDALARIRSQLSIEEKRALSDVIIDNSVDWEKTDRQVRELYETWLNASPTSSPH